MTVYGYARVSTDDQTLENQHEALKSSGATKIFSEKLSGATASNRKELQKALKGLRAGDVLICTRLDRLARSTLDLLNITGVIAQRGAAMRSLADPWVDTGSPHGELMLTILAGLATFERHLIKARTAEGRVRAKARGVRFGRKPKLNQHQRREALARLAAGESQSDVARTFAVDPSMISRLASSS